VCTNAASRARDDDPPLCACGAGGIRRAHARRFRLSRRAKFTSVINLKTIVRHSRARDLAVAHRQGDRMMRITGKSFWRVWFTPTIKQMAPRGAIGTRKLPVDTHAIYDRDDLMPERIELMQFGLTRSVNCAATADQSSRSPDHGCCWPNRQIA